MFLIWSLEIATADTPRFLRSNEQYFLRKWQIPLMVQFYSAISQDWINEFSMNNPSLDYCDWNGVQCVNGMVCQVEYGYKKYGNFDIHSLPPAVETISMIDSGQKYSLHTRSLPRELTRCDLLENRLFGTVDLQTLPRKLSYLNAAHNKLTGPIDLTALPCSLRYLYLHHNRIVQTVVYYDCLPSEVHSIVLVGQRHATNRIGGVCAVHPDMAVEYKDIHVFSNMSEKKIR